MVVKTVTMSEMRKAGAVPKSPDKVHQERTGKGNYNRWNLLQETRPRTLSEGKRPREVETGLDNMSKAPRLDDTLVLEQLSRSENNIRDIRKVLDESRKAGDNGYSAVDGGMGTAFFKMWEAVSKLVDNQEVISSMVADQMKLTSKVSKEQDKVIDQVKEVGTRVMNYAEAAGSKQGEHQQGRQGKSPPSEEDRCKRRIRQAINKAERASLLFGLDMGDVPTMNKETLARKVTIDLHKKGKTGAQDAGYDQKQVESMTDDMLSCAGLDFLGSSTRKYDNKFKTDDPNNGKFCTIPVKMIFKTKKERIQAEQHLRKVCKV